MYTITLLSRNQFDSLVDALNNTTLQYSSKRLDLDFYELDIIANKYIHIELVCSMANININDIKHKIENHTYIA